MQIAQYQLEWVTNEYYHPEFGIPDFLSLHKGNIFNYVVKELGNMDLFN